MVRTSLPGRRPPRPPRHREAERGQLLVVFALALVAIIGMVGLIIDGGDTFLQRRDQQNVADAAAMAAGYAYVNGQDPTAAAQAVASSNGYTNGQNGATVTVTTGSSITVDVSRPHQNYFAGVMGFASWGVSATASVAAGVPNAAYGAMPIIFNEKAFWKAGNSCNPNGNNASCTSVSFDEPGTGSQDVPQTDSTFNWTVFCTANGNPCNGNSNTVDDLINSRGTTTTISVGQTSVGPLNAGAHTTLFNDLAAMINDAYPVVIVNDAGEPVGFSYFYLTGSVGGSTKQISGWFGNPINVQAMTIVQGAGTGKALGAYTVKLTN